jgi:hypothetical protein
VGANLRIDYRWTAGDADRSRTYAAEFVALAHLIVTLAAKYRLPAVYRYRYYITSGGLISYGLDATDQYRRAAGYIDRILGAVVTHVVQ